MDDIKEALISFGDLDVTAIESIIDNLEDMHPSDSLSLTDLSELIYDDTGIKYSLMELQFVFEELQKEGLIQINADDEVMIA